MVYTSIIKPLLFRLEPEAAHNLMVRMGVLLGDTALGRSMVSLLYGYRGPDISTMVDGITYRTPVLLSAGFDYNGQLTQILPSLGFGGEEVGSVTAKPCAGNPAPRLTRLPRSKSIIVNKGLKNDGVIAVIARLKATPRMPGFVIGISIAKTNDATTVSVEDGIADYLASFTALCASDVGDYYTLNVSCPNAFGGETFAEASRLEKLLAALSPVSCQKPVYVKMPINLAWESFQAMLDVMRRYPFIKGVIIGNLNKDYSSLDVREEAPADYRGGLSGKPCFLTANELIRKTREYVGAGFTIIGSGGIMSADDAQEKIAAGADLLQMITGMIYEGPSVVSSISYGIAAGKKK
jgi:dihydroorotate dehydrogenase subfamily 2